MKSLWIASCMTLTASLSLGACSDNSTSMKQSSQIEKQQGVKLITDTPAPVAQKIPHELTAHGVVMMTITGCEMIVVKTRKC